MPRRNRKKPQQPTGFVARLKDQLARLKEDYEELRDDAQQVAAERDEAIQKAAIAVAEIRRLHRLCELRRRLTPRRAARVLAERSEN